MKLPSLPTIYAFSSIKCIPPTETLFKHDAVKLMSMWYPVAFKKQVRPGSLFDIKIANEPFVLYLDESEKPVSEIKAVFGICPHQAASFKTGNVDRITGDVICPYHGFRFNDANFTGITEQSKAPKHTRICIPKLPVLVDNDIVYVRPTFKSNPSLTVDNVPYQVPELADPSFVHFSGSTVIQKHADVVTENVLDMIHISYVHFFGNRNSPLPYHIKYKQLSPSSGKTTFYYHSGPRSISKLWSKTSSVVVENEFYLPSTTVTRVKAGNNLIKTIVTRALPISEDKSILFWELHRNFWCSDPIIEALGTWFLKIMMYQTLSEDIHILKNVDTNQRLTGFLTVYDKTIEGFRRAKELFTDDR